MLVTDHRFVNDWMELTVTGGVKTEELVGVTTLDLRPVGPVGLGSFTDGDVQEVFSLVPLGHGIGAEVASNATGVVISQGLDNGAQAVHGWPEGTNVRLSTARMWLASVLLELLHRKKLTS